MNKSQDNDNLIVSMKNVGKVFRMGEVEVHALRDVSLDILEGELLIIVGPSGSGKSTLLNLIGGMDRPTSGDIFYRSENLGHFSDKQLTLYRRRRIGFIFQFYNLIPTLTALENVQVAVELVNDAMDPRRALDMVGLKQRATHFPSQLSGGEQQRVAIARALASKPAMLLCDEPTGAIDLQTSRRILGMLIKLKNELNKTILIITHNNAIAGIGDRVAHMRDGSLYSVKTNRHPISVQDISW